MEVHSKGMWHNISNIKYAIEIDLKQNIKNNTKNMKIKYGKQNM